MTASKAEPAARVYRGASLESEHCGVAAVVDADGPMVAQLGDPELVTFPRSSLKPFQALALVTSGAADRFGLEGRHLALACASHRGEPWQTAPIAAWLARIGCKVADLACGADPPADPATHAAMLQEGKPFTPLHHNCSGKHTGFLTLCRHRGWPIRSYADSSHPAQEDYLAALASLTGTAPGSMPLAFDNCCLPAPALSVTAMARAVAGFAASTSTGQPQGQAMGRLLEAMRQHPEFVSGTDHPMVRLVRASRGRVIAKTGAEGYLAAFLPEARLGIALKIQDGNGRAAFPLLIEILAALGLLHATALGELEATRRPRIRDSRGREVGHLEATAEGLVR